MLYRAALLLSVVCGVSALDVTSLSAEPTKKSPARRGYDFSRPDPQEILPNPKEGVGSPPQLRTYVSVKEMATTGSTIKKRSSGPPDAEQSNTKPVSAKASGPEAMSSPKAGAQSATAAELDDWRSSTNARVVRHVENILAGQIADRGIDGTFHFEPSAAAQGDPAILASEKRTWDRVVQSLELSSKNWQTAHKAGAISGSAPSTAELSPPNVQPGPGVFLLRGAPANVIGDLADITR